MVRMYICKGRRSVRSMLVAGMAAAVTRPLANRSSILCIEEFCSRLMPVTAQVAGERTAAPAASASSTNSLYCLLGRVSSSKLSSGTAPLLSALCRGWTALKKQQRWDRHNWSPN